MAASTEPVTQQRTGPGPESAASSSSDGYFGEFGGRYVPEALLPALEELEQAYLDAKADPAFEAEFTHLISASVGCGLSRSRSVLLSAASFFRLRPSSGRVLLHTISAGRTPIIDVRRTGGVERKALDLDQFSPRG